ncbi:hypothetical protein RSOL_513740, partial [Rhizoctonia solani AG-3 Rhs1AP]
MNPVDQLPLLTSQLTLGSEHLPVLDLPEPSNELQHICDALRQRLDQTMIQSNQSLDNTMANIKGFEERFVGWMTTFYARDRVEVASSLNASALDDADGLFALPLRNGDMPGDVFPPTLGALRALTGNELNNLINMYGMVKSKNIPHLVADCRKLVGHYFGVRNV